MVDTPGHADFGGEVCVGPNNSFSSCSLPFDDGRELRKTWNLPVLSREHLV